MGQFGVQYLAHEPPTFCLEDDEPATAGNSDFCYVA